MDNFRSSDVLGSPTNTTTGIRAVSGSDTMLNAPSGFEVESASFHMPVASCSSGTQTGWKSKMNGLASRGTEAVNQMKQNVTAKYGEMKPVVQQKIESMRTDVMDRVSTLKSTVNDRMTTMRGDAISTASNVQTDMRVNPMKWAGIAAGTGLGLGLISRLIDHRQHKHVRRHNHVPQLVIIESAC